MRAPSLSHLALLLPILTVWTAFSPTPVRADVLQLRCTFEDGGRMQYVIDLATRQVTQFEPTNNAQYTFVDGAGGPTRDDVKIALRAYVTIDTQLIRFGLNQCPSKTWLLRLACDEKTIQATAIDRVRGTVVLDDGQGQKNRGQCERNEIRPKF